MELLVVGGLAWLCIAIVWSIVKQSKTKWVSSTLAKEFPRAEIYVSSDDRSFCVLDFEAAQITLGLNKARGGLATREPPYRDTHPFSAIIEVELQRDGTTVTQTNRGSQAVGAAVGALAFGGLGAIVGGLSASSTTRNRVRTISLIVKVADRSRPLHQITFLNWTADKKGLKTDSSIVKHASQQIEKFAAHVTNAMREGQALPHANAVVAPSPQVAFTAQIRDLWSLKESGAITQSEFDVEKARLLSRP